MSDASIYKARGAIIGDHPVVRLVNSWLAADHWERGQVPVQSYKQLARILANNRGTRGSDGRLLEIALGDAGFAIPCREFFTVVKETLTRHATGKLVEIGAGQGFLSALLKLAGANVVTTDIEPSQYDVRHCSIRKMGAAAALDRYPDRAVLLSWPDPTFSCDCNRVSAVGREVLTKLRPGNFLFYIHSDSYEPQLLEKIREECIQIAPGQELPTFRPERNVLRVFRKCLTLQARVRISVPLS